MLILGKHLPSQKMIAPIMCLKRQVFSKRIVPFVCSFLKFLFLFVLNSKHKSGTVVRNFQNNRSLLNQHGTTALLIQQERNQCSDNLIFRNKLFLLEQLGEQVFLSVFIFFLRYYFSCSWFPLFFYFFCFFSFL